MLLLIASSSIEIYSQRKINVWLNSYTSEQKYCGVESDKEFIIAVETGRIYAADTLYGFNFELSYNPKKLRFDNKLIMNTLAEFFEMSDATFHSEGIVRGYAVNLKNKIVYGDKPLMAFVGKFLSNCDDTANININYIEFTDEFKPIVDSLRGLTLKMTKKVNNNEITSILSDSTNYLLYGTESRNIEINAKYNSIKTYTNTKLTLSNTNDLLVYNLKSNNKSVSISNIKYEKNQTSAEIVLTNNIKNNIIFDFDVKSMINDNFSGEIKALFEILDECNCINTNNELKIKVNNIKKDTIVNKIPEFSNEDYKLQNDLLIKTERISKMSIYNINGILISEISDDKNEFSLKNLNSGIYFIVYNINNDRKINKILINKL